MYIYFFISTLPQLLASSFGITKDVNKKRFLLVLFFRIRQLFLFVERKFEVTGKREEKSIKLTRKIFRRFHPNPEIIYFFANFEYIYSSCISDPNPSNLSFCQRGKIQGNKRVMNNLWLQIVRYNPALQVLIFCIWFLFFFFFQNCTNLHKISYLFYFLLSHLPIRPALAFIPLALIN